MEAPSCDYLLATTHIIASLLKPNKIFARSPNLFLTMHLA